MQFATADRIYVDLVGKPLQNLIGEITTAPADHLDQGGTQTVRGGTQGDDRITRTGGRYVDQSGNSESLRFAE